MAIPIIVFLGNPGARYAMTRHNLGWWVADLVAGETRLAFKPGQGPYLEASGRVAGQKALLVKPTTFMNASGEAFDHLSRKYDLSPESLLVVADDLALPLGQLRLRGHGSSGGHNGLASIIACLGTEQFARVRCGIGPLPAGVDAAEFVLDPFGPGELIAAREMAARAAEAVAMVLARGLVAAADAYNRKPPAPETSAEGSSGAQ
ncbi:MAG: aminoacyl-tRNA hydrolase [Candidatus Zixiibacteriota bacterium]